MLIYVVGKNGLVRPVVVVENKKGKLKCEKISRTNHTRWLASLISTGLKFLTFYKLHSTFSLKQLCEQQMRR